MSDYSNNNRTSNSYTDDDLDGIEFLDVQETNDDYIYDFDMWQYTSDGHVYVLVTLTVDCALDGVPAFVRPVPSPYFNTLFTVTDTLWVPPLLLFYGLILCKQQEITI